MGKTKVSCDCKVIHEDVVKLYKKGFRGTKILLSLSDFFKLLGDNTRISILSILDNNEVCVSDIANILDMTKSAVSHQLNLLKKEKLVKSEKKGKEIYYSFSDENVKGIFELAIEHLRQ